MNGEQSQRLEEYKTLREELLLNTQQKWKTQLFCLTFITAILSFALKYKQPWLCLFAWLVSFYCWRDNVGLTSAIVKFGTYIRVFIEPYLPGLNWERRNRVVGQHAVSKSNRPKWIRSSLIVLDDLSMPYAIMSLSSILIGFTLAYSMVQFQYKNCLLVISVVSIVVIHVFVTSKVSTSLWSCQRIKWDEMFLEMKEKELSQQNGPADSQLKSLR